MIDIRNLNYTYPNQSQPVLKNVSLQIASGEFVLLKGESGAGKSTLLRCLNGLVPHFNGGTITGRVWVNGLDVIDVGPSVMSQQVGFVVQNPEAQAVLDVVEAEIAFGLENLAIPQAEMVERVNEVLGWLRLEHLRERPLHTLSGGERQRLAIATVLALRPNILVLDEPTSQLDAESAEELLQTLVRLNKELGLTIVLSEHRLARILPFVDRVLAMADGEIVADEVATLNDHWRLELGDYKMPRTTHHASRNSLLSVKNLSFGYVEPVLKGVDLQVGAGEAVAIMGRNGSGKSTLLKCVVGLLKGDGVVAVNGRSTHNRSVADICREVAYLPQNPDDLLFADSVHEELAITLKNHQLEEQGIDEMLADLGLAHFAEAYPRDLSVGQRQRVALGAVAITQTKLLMFDEPTRGLDGRAKRKLVEIWSHWLEKGMGILLVTHDAELVAQVATRLLRMENGQLHEEI